MYKLVAVRFEDVHEGMHAKCPEVGDVGLVPTPGFLWRCPCSAFVMYPT